MGQTLQRLANEINTRASSFVTNRSNIQGTTIISPSNDEGTTPRIAVVIELFALSALENSLETQDGANSENQTMASENQSSGENFSLAATPSGSQSNLRQLSRPIRRILLLLTDDVASRVFQVPSPESELQELIAQLFSQQVPSTPASKKVLESLPQILITQNIVEKSKCPICFEDLHSQKIAVKLPCEHIFDKDCLLPWLNEHHTCPVCRYELPVDDEDFEKERKERMASRSAVDEESFFKWNSPERAGSEVEIERNEPVPDAEELENEEIEIEAVSDDNEEGIEESENNQRRSVTNVNINTRAKRKEDWKSVGKFKRWLATEQKRKEDE